MGTTFKICGQACCRESPHINGKRKIFDSARREYGGDFESGTVDGVITVLGMLPVFFFIIMFWAIYSQVLYRFVYFSVLIFVTEICFVYNLFHLFT